MKRSRSWYRYQRKRAIRRKTGILRKAYGADDVECWTLGHPGKLSKGKIHYSCWMCRRKSYDAPSMSDWRKLVSAVQAMEEENDEE